MFWDTVFHVSFKTGTTAAFPRSFHKALTKNNNNNNNKQTGWLVSVWKVDFGWSLIVIIMTDENSVGPDRNIDEDDLYTFLNLPRDVRFPT